jgi:flagellar hook-length control protein FliK
MRAAQQRDGRVQVRLAPPELGSLRIELSVQNGVMAARLEAETPAARTALLDNLPALRERLAEQNIRVEKFDVDVRSDSRGSGGNNEPHDRPTDHGDSGSQERRGRTAAQTRITTARTPHSAAAVTDAGLDVRI